MRLKLRSRNNIVALSPFGSLVQEAVQVTQRLRTLDSNPSESNLKPEAFLKEVMALDESISLKSITKLRKALERNPPNLTHSNASLRRMVSALRGPNLRRPPPAKNLERTIRWLNTEPAIAEQIRFGSSPVELLCVAVQVAGENHPECFGRRTSSAEIDKERAELTAKRDELYRRIGTEVTAADLHIDDTGTGPVTFACAPTINLAPRANAGERVVNHLLLAQPSEQMRQAEREEREKRDKRIAEAHADQ
jgi:hypothetical protein